MRTLLLADDNVTVQRVIALTFAQEPVRVVTASDGHQAMDRMEVERPDIVLAGTTLPQVNGYELARFVRSKAELKNVPVLLLSGAFETVDEAQLKSSGAAGVIEKPVEPKTVISRVKELLGLKAAGKEAAPSSGRLVTPPAVTPESTAAPPVAPGGATSAPPAAVDPLESAYDTLDQQMAGRVPTAQRNPSPPLGPTATSRDPRSPGKPPASGQMADAGNPVYEVDEDWFGDSEPKRTPPDDSRREMAEDLHPGLRAPEPEAPRRAEATPVYEVDDEWFAEDQKARETRELEQKQLAAEMGIHEVKLAPAPEPAKSVERVKPVEAATRVEPIAPVRAQPVEPVRTQPVEPVEPAGDEYEPEPIARSLPIDWFAQGAPKKKPAPPVAVELPAPAAPIEVAHAAPTPIAEFDTARPMTSATPGRVADDFAALLAFEQGARTMPPMIEPVIHAVTPEITPEMIEEIAATVADRLRANLRVEPPEITGEMIKTMAFLVSKDVRNHIRIEPAVPQITPEMIRQIASMVSAQLKDAIRVEPAAPQITPEIIQQIASMVSAQLKDAIRVEPAAPVITAEMIYQISEMVATQLRDAIRVEPRAPEINEGMLHFIAGNVADRLRDSVRVEPRAPEITDEMLGRIAEHVAVRLKDSIRVEPAIPELNATMLDQIAGTVTTRLTDTVEGSVAGSMQVVIAEVKDSIREAVKASAVPPQLTNEMLDHMAWTVADRITNAMPTPPPPAAPFIRDDMLNVVAPRVAERVQGNFSIDRIKDAITESVRDTVRAVVAETSERLVREEIERIKSKAQ
jgi:CheY-like chemotaxis protein